MLIELLGVEREVIDLDRDRGKGSRVWCVLIGCLDPAPRIKIGSGKLGLEIEMKKTVVKLKVREEKEIKGQRSEVEGYYYNSK